MKWQVGVVWGGGWGGCVFFFFNDTATTEIYTLSLHDALPISQAYEHAVILEDDAILQTNFAAMITDFQLKNYDLLLLDHWRAHVDRWRNKHIGAGAVAHRAQICLLDRKSTRLNSSHVKRSRMPSSA